MTTIWLNALYFLCVSDVRLTMNHALGSLRKVFFLMNDFDFVMTVWVSHVLILGVLWAYQAMG